MIKEIISPFSFPGLKKENLDKEKYFFLFPNDYIPTRNQVLNVLSEQSGFTVEEILSPSRKRDIVNVRNVYCKILYTKLKITLKEIGNSMGGKDHTTTINNLKNFDAHYQNEENFKKFADKVCKKLKIEL
jgi:chromosomal replication initiator protein